MIQPDDPPPGADPDDPGAPESVRPSDTAEDIGDLVRAAVDRALAQWDVVFGAPPPGDEDDEDDLDGFTVGQSLVGAGVAAANRYLSERGLSVDGLLAAPTSAFLAEHGLALRAVVLEAVEQALGAMLRHQLDGEPSGPATSDARSQIDLTELLGPEEP